jgi:hypothetical protein
LGSSHVDFEISLKGTSDTSLCFTGVDMKLQGYVDADLVGDVDIKKNTTRFVHNLSGTSAC